MSLARVSTAFLRRRSVISLTRKPVARTTARRWLSSSASEALERSSRFNRLAPRSKLRERHEGREEDEEHHDGHREEHHRREDLRDDRRLLFHLGLELGAELAEGVL